MLVSGLFQSKLIYCITVWGRIWDIPGSLDEEKRTSASLTKDDLRKLQVLQNKCLRLITNCDYKTPTETLLRQTNMLSVHQLTAQLTLSQVFSIHQSKLPSYHCQRLYDFSGQPKTRSITSSSAKRTDFELSLARTSFFYQSSRLWAALPQQVKNSRNKFEFKRRCKTWVKMNIAVKPS